MDDIARGFIRKSLELIDVEYLPKINQCLQRLTEEDVWWRPAEAANSVGNLVLHLQGNVTEWVIGGVGGRHYVRRRQEEFDQRGSISKAELMAGLHATMAEAGRIIGSQSAESLLEPRRIQGYDGTVLEAIYHVVEHFGMHTGQIIQLTKMRTAEDLKLWVPREAPSPSD